MSAIGLDIGHSAVKVAAGGDTHLFPTAACKATDLSTAEAAQAAKADAVTVDSTDYFVGRTALTHANGRVLEGLSDNWIDTPEHNALMIAGFRKGLAMLDNSDDAILVMGLPSRLLGAQQKRLAELARMHLSLPADRIRVLPQAMGAFMSIVLDKDGSPVDGRQVDEERWGVIDIGYYTTDYGLIDGGIWSAAGAKSAPGANTVAAQLREALAKDHQVDLPLRKCDEVLRTRKLKIYGQPVDVSQTVDDLCETYARSVIEGAVAALGDALPTLDGVLVAGGGADLIFSAIKKQFGHAISAQSPRVSIAEGLQRYGLLASKSRS